MTPAYFIEEIRYLVKNRHNLGAKRFEVQMADLFERYDTGDGTMRPGIELGTRFRYLMEEIVAARFDKQTVLTLVEAAFREARKHWTDKPACSRGGARWRIWQGGGVMWRDPEDIEKWGRFVKMTRW